MKFIGLAVVLLVTVVVFFSIRWTLTIWVTHNEASALAYVTSMLMFQVWWMNVD